MLYRHVGLAALLLFVFAGCTVEIGGSAHGNGGTDDVQFFPSGSEFKLDREAAREKAYEADADAQARHIEAQLKIKHENTSTK